MSAPGSTVTKARKLRTLLAIVECVPATHTMTVFESAMRRGDLAAFWDHYQEVLRRSTPDEELTVFERSDLLRDDRAGHAGRV